MSGSSINCAFCHHPRSQHCKGGADHSWSKGNFEQMSHCVSKHCKNPLCCCVDFVEPAAVADARAETKQEMPTLF